MRHDFLEYAPHIVEIFSKMNKELLLVLKTNNYLRTIDMRLGSPGNNFRVVNEVSWRVYCKEILPFKKLSRVQRFREVGSYWFLKCLMMGYFWILKMKQICGMAVRP